MILKNTLWEFQFPMRPWELKWYFLVDDWKNYLKKRSNYINGWASTYATQPLGSDVFVHFLPDTIRKINHSVHTLIAYFIHGKYQITNSSYSTVQQIINNLDIVGNTNSLNHLPCYIWQTTSGTFPGARNTILIILSRFWKICSSFVIFQKIYTEVRWFVFSRRKQCNWNHVTDVYFFGTEQNWSTW